MGMLYSRCSEKTVTCPASLAASSVATGSAADYPSAAPRFGHGPSQHRFEGSDSVREKGVDIKDGIDNGLLPVPIPPLELGPEDPMTPLVVGLIVALSCVLGCCGIMACLGKKCSRDGRKRCSRDGKGSGMLTPLANVKLEDIVGISLKNLVRETIAKMKATVQNR